MTDFEAFGLSQPVLQAIHKMGFVEASPIQKKAIPLVLEGKDILGQAQTGTGKTAAFGIPMADRLPADSPEVQALILCPTRELAVQVAEEIHELCLFSGHKVLPVYGGQRIDRQITALRRGVQVVVGTPGRILDHLGRGTLKLASVRMLVLDEADMMLDMGFLPDIRRVIRQCAQERQTLLFSATIPAEIERIARDYMRDPVSVSVVPETLTLEETEQIFYEVPEDEKIDALMRLLDYSEEGSSAIIFCRTRRNVDKLTRKLKARGYDVDGLHGDLTQQQRDRVMQDFREDKFPYLVATDVASRGLDISHVTHVINFHVPQDPEAYVHRIGRTGRMGRSGVAITFVTPAEYWDLLRIQEFSMAQIEEGELPSVDEVEERRRAARGDTKARRRVRQADLEGGRAAAGDGGGAAPARARPARVREETEKKETFVALPALGEEPATEAERRQRRYAQRDSRKRIEWTAAEEAIKEAARIEHEAILDVIHEEAAVSAGETEAPDAVKRREEEEAAIAQAAFAAARKADLEARLREAERLVAEELRAKAGETRLEPAAASAADFEQMPAAPARDVEPGRAELPILEPDEEARILRALRLRDQVNALVRGLDQRGLDDFLAIVDRLAMDHDLRRITAALLKMLAARPGDLKDAISAGAAVASPARAPLEEVETDEDEETEEEGADSGDERQMTRLFISIGRRARVNKEGVRSFIQETAGISEDDIGRIDLLHNFAFVEVRKAVASKVIEKMHETMFRGREISVEQAKSSGRQ